MNAPQVIEHESQTPPKQGRAVARKSAGAIAQDDAPLTPMDMLNRAVSQGANIDVLEKLMGLQERWEKNQARKAFDGAIAAAKAEIPVIIKNSTGHNAKKYADFAAIARVVDPIIGKHGLSYRFRTAQTAEAIHVTCVLSHEAGHYEETTLAGPADATGNKNAIQAIGSTLTYLQRYSLVQALGLAASNDDDGKATSNGGTVSKEQELALDTLIEEVAADKPKFLTYFKIEKITDLPAKEFDNALALLNAKRKKS